MKIYPKIAIEIWCETRYKFCTIENDNYFYGHIQNDLFFWDNTTSLVTCPACNGTHYINISK